jgi:hypothetical protein
MSRSYWSAAISSSRAIRPSRQTVRSPWMRPCAFSTRFQAPPLEGEIIHGIGDHPAEPTKTVLAATRHTPHSIPNRAPRRRSTSAAVSASEASNSCGVCTPRYSASRGDLAAVVKNTARGVAATLVARADSVIRGVLSRTAAYFSWRKFASSCILIIAFKVDGSPTAAGIQEHKENA